MFMIFLRDIKHKETIGQGGFGEIYKADIVCKFLIYFSKTSIYLMFLIKFQDLKLSHLTKLQEKDKRINTFRIPQKQTFQQLNQGNKFLIILQ